MSRSLLLMDTDKIKNYVFGTNKLRDIRGASAILDDLNRITMPDIVRTKTKGDYEQIFSNGGVGEFIIPTDSVEAVKKEITEQYEQKGASLTCCHIELPSGFDIKKENSEFYIKNIAYDMQLLKNQSDTKIAISNPYFRTCDICHEEVASFRDGVDRNIYFCKRCKSKREKFTELKRKTPRYFRKANPAFDNSMRSKLIKKLKDLENEKALKFSLTEDLAFPDEIKDIDADGNNYIALIYADGNDMKKNIEQLKIFDDHRKFSINIDEAIFSALADAINQFLHPYVNKRHETPQIMLPFDVLLLGGDDLVIVCQAKQALNVAIEICNKFHQKTGEFSLSVGVAFAHTNFPIRILLRVAENLLKVAKKERAKTMRREKDQEQLDTFTKNQIEEFQEGTINFMTISNSSSLLYDDYFNDILQNEFKGETFIKTLRPYSPKQLKRLLKIGNDIKSNSFPKSKLEYLGEALFSNKYNSMLQSLFILTRTNKTQKELLRLLFHFYPELKTIPPWQSLSYDEKTNKTAILDILEIYRFLGEK